MFVDSQIVILICGEYFGVFEIFICYYASIKTSTWLSDVYVERIKSVVAIYVFMGDKNDFYCGSHRQVAPAAQGKQAPFASIKRYTEIKEDIASTRNSIFTESYRFK